MYLQLKNASKQRLVLTQPQFYHTDILNPFHCCNLHSFPHLRMKKANYECFLNFFCSQREFFKSSQTSRVQIKIFLILCKTTRELFPLRRLFNDSTFLFCLRYLSFVNYTTFYGVHSVEVLFILCYTINSL